MKKQFTRAISIIAIITGLLGLILTRVNIHRVEANQGNGQPKLYIKDDHKVQICHATNSHNNPYTQNNVDKNSIVSVNGNETGHDAHNGPVWYSGIANHSWGDIIPTFDYYICQESKGNDSCNKHTYLGQNWPEGKDFRDNDCNKPSPKKSVSINKSEISCGPGIKTFSGTANFRGSNDDHLLVYLGNDLELHRHDEPNNWSFTKYVGLGTHTITAKIYDRPNNGYGNNHNHNDKVAEDEWTFKVEACESGEPVNCSWSDFGACVLEEGEECGSGTRTREVVQEAKKDARGCSRSKKWW